MLIILFMLLAYSPEVYAEKIKIHPPVSLPVCCTSVLSTSPLLDARAQMSFSAKDKNPYMTTWEREKFSIQIKENQDFFYTPPSRFGNSQQIPKLLHFWVPDYPAPLGSTFDKAPPQEIYNRLNQILKPEKRYPNQSIDIRQITTYLTNGSQSFVFFLHPPYFNKNEGTEKKIWALNHSNYVIKLRKASPWNRGLEEAAKQIRRDIVIPSLFDLCAKNYLVQENGKKYQFIQTVLYDEKSTLPQDGIFVQKTVFGKTAYYLAQQLNKAQNGDSSALQIIKSQGFASILELERKLLLLEKFYQLTHKDIVNFQMINHIDGPSGVIPGKNTSEPVRTSVIGFDFNQGQNVIWDSKNKIFKAIDF